ncbi:PIH1 domain-containing protein 2-like isoform X2 [Limulus polyphemus]|uniref:PIH1 domain-containing protein 2-like isoform X2 n=1 Tax=Limulus polyphemus TaxID=6850 RepID=A0ABM1T3Y7_LIMPO|nr:PIH1 domain-containing protein 2-like isoform X2 [Limulus polyphemus]
MERKKTSDVTMAQKIWMMLDNLVENDPLLYRKCIEHQLKQAKLHMEPPKLVVTFKMELLFDRTKTVFINIFEWIRIPNPEGEKSLIPMLGTAPMPLLKKEKESNSQDVLVIAVALHPNNLYRIKVEEKKQKDVMQAVRDFLAVQNLCVSHHYTVVTPAGDIAAQQEELSNQLNQLMQDHNSKKKRNNDKITVLDTFSSLQIHEEKEPLMTPIKTVIKKKLNNKDQKPIMRNGVGDIPKGNREDISQDYGVEEMQKENGGGECEEKRQVCCPEYEITRQLVNNQMEI